MNWPFTLFFYFLLSISSISVSFSQYSELREYGFKGRVKSMVTTQYQLITYKKDDYTPIDTSMWNWKSRLFFNTSGNVDSITGCVNYANYVPSDDNNTNCYKTLYYYNMIGKKQTGLDIGDVGSDKKNPIVVEWPNEHQYIERTYTPNLELKTENTVWLNRNFRDSAGTSLFYSQGELISNTTFMSDFNEKGELIRNIGKDLVTGITDTTYYKIKSYDHEGNPTVIYLYEGNSTEPKAINIRKYQYYRD